MHSFNHKRSAVWLGFLGLCLALIARAGTSSAIWSKPMTFAAGQHASTPQSYRDFELTFRARIEGSLMVDLPRAARIEFNSGAEAVDDTVAESVWHVLGLPRGVWTEIRLVRVGSVTDLWIDGRRRPGPDKVGNPFRNGGWDQMAKASPVVFESKAAAAELDQMIVRELAAAESAAYVSARGAAGRRTLPIAPDMTGWAGATEAVEIGEGMMTWREGERGKILYWDEALRDFEFEFEFNLTPGTNNGVVLRYAGVGRAIYASMCEIQIADQNYAALRKPSDLRQTHGSAYGLVAARQGYQRPAGEWNHERITVRGSRVVVELNGTTILDADLWAVPDAEVMGGKRLPGLMREDGYVGFAGHGDPITFKNIRLRKL